MAAHHYLISLLENLKARGCGFFHMGYAIAVRAGECSDGLKRQAQIVFINDFVVFDIVNGCVRSQNSQLLGFAWGESNIGNLDDVFAAELA